MPNVSLYVGFEPIAHFHVDNRVEWFVMFLKWQQMTFSWLLTKVPQVDSWAQIQGQGQLIVTQAPERCYRSSAYNLRTS